MSTCKKKTTLYEHNLRVALRKLLSIDALSAKTLGFCFDSRLKSKIKLLLKESSGLRDIEELLFFAPDMIGTLAITKEIYQKELISKLSATHNLTQKSIATLLVASFATEWQYVVSQYYTHKEPSIML